MTAMDVLFYLAGAVQLIAALALFGCAWRAIGLRAERQRLEAERRTDE